MKKTRLSILLVLGIFLIAGCSCSKEKFTVTFDSNGGTYIEKQIVTKGDKVEKPKTPIKEGFLFDYWSLDEEKYDFNNEVQEDITLTAVWKENKKEEVKEVVTNNEEKDKIVCTNSCSNGYYLDSSTCACEKVRVSKVVVNKNEVNLINYDSYSINASVYPSSSLNKGLKYESSDKNILTVNEIGEVTALNSGVAYVTISSLDTNVKSIIKFVIDNKYEYYAEALDSSDISYKVYIYKNNVLLSNDELKEINAVYTSDGDYIGRYEEETKAIMVDKSQIDKISMIKVDNIDKKVVKK